MSLVFAGRMKMRGGKIARYEGKCAFTGKHRLLASNKFVEWHDPKDVYTIWLVDDEGRCRGDKAPSNFDVMGSAA